MFLKFKAEVENQLDKKIKRLRSDKGGEYGDDYLKEFCESNALFTNLLPLIHHNRMVYLSGKIELLWK